MLLDVSRVNRLGRLLSVNWLVNISLLLWLTETWLWWNIGSSRALNTLDDAPDDQSQDNDWQDAEEEDKNDKSSSSSLSGIWIGAIVVVISIGI